MRVISGTAKGVRLYCPEGLDVRPTADRIKESIFNILQLYIPGAVVLDLFSGSGALGIESLSRGAEKAVFVDQSKQSVQFIKKNLMAAKLVDRATVLCMPVKKALEKLDSQFDLIFMDPPYLKGLITPTLEDIGLKNLLKEEGIIVVEHDSKDFLPDTITFFVRYRQKQYGRTTVSFYKRFEER
ncbi:16S rRNA (guanine(966)-N(2))-methyltransferase RsmD [Caldanaerobius fijiensis DSM 17918]|uniref:16S rRNA (Guanine(966)-N(2))-methyltransferase RsmD n=1 Tax=Caldanaerobius fijiensis DSM 17918 TaxID=1121256 RepID=A0A1M4ZS44_9THEO|nr:16S rRNA (guanine(966)-N(2))-methyltransferase RsmD [Caldanaerobius fijiensis]SHF20841.1 16S rRNA (guanine(966)-N(2))-methyltransferase RsmD [Caldanaerobius fijiensis DSM 17918]